METKCYHPSPAQRLNKSTAQYSDVGLHLNGKSIILKAQDLKMKKKKKKSKDFDIDEGGTYAKLCK